MRFFLFFYTAVMNRINSALVSVLTDLTITTARLIAFNMLLLMQTLQVCETIMWQTTSTSCKHRHKRNPMLPERQFQGICLNKYKLQLQ